ncbi:MAG: helix-turn-helix transcriptional regulator [Candidatus Levybacteria bacterium]|nr:helix-turn-helix transcriptional regulator [Candidatus Levybacteria bacterium]
MSKEQVGKNLKKARKNLKLTQLQVADKVGISSNYYSMIERGEINNPGSQVMSKIAKALRLEPSDVFPF